MAASTGIATGKNEKTNSGSKNSMAPALIAMPYRPSVHRRAGSGCPRILLRRTHPIVIMYEERSDEMVKEMMAFSAAVEPMLMRESNVVTTKETMTAFKGIFQPGVTYNICKPTSAFQGFLCLHMRALARKASHHLERRTKSDARLWRLH